MTDDDKRPMLSRPKTLMKQQAIGQNSSDSDKASDKEKQKAIARKRATMHRTRTAALLFSDAPEQDHLHGGDDDSEDEEDGEQNQCMRWLNRVVHSRFIRSLRNPTVSMSALPRRC